MAGFFVGTTAAAAAAAPAVVANVPVALAAAAPAAIPWLGIAATSALIGGVGLSAVGLARAGQARAADVRSQAFAALGRQQDARSQQAIARYNAQVAENEARSIEIATLYRQRRHAREAQRRGSSLLAALGASGAVPSEGAPLELQATQAAEDELDIMLLGHEAQIRAERARSQARLDVMQATIHGRQALQFGRQARAFGGRAGSFQRAGQLQAGATLLQGFGVGVSRGFN